jgi:hypothetical protein
MLVLQSLNIQLENLKVVFEDALNKGSSIDELKRLYQQIKELEKLIAERKGPV